MRKEKIIVVVVIFCIVFMSNVFANNVTIYDEEVKNDNISELATGDTEKYNFQLNGDGTNTVTLTKYLDTAVINYIPDSLDNKYFVTRIADGVFENSTYVRLAGIQNGILYLGKGVFKNCSKMTQASIGTGIKVISEETFYGGSNLKTVTGGVNVIEIGDKAFYNCTTLQSVALNDNIKKIGSQAFYNCRFLTLSSLPSKIEEIGEEAFYNCEDFSTNVIVMPSSLKSIGANAFYNTSIKYIKFSSDDLPTLGDNALEGTLLLPIGWRDNYNNSTKGYDKYNIIEMLFGDANDDNFVNSTDAAIVLDMFKNNTAPSEELERLKIDMDGNGMFNSTDAAMILDIFKNR